MTKEFTSSAESSTVVQIVKVDACANCADVLRDNARMRKAIHSIVRDAEVVEFEPEGVCHFRVLTCRWDEIEMLAREGR